MPTMGGWGTTEARNERDALEIRLDEMCAECEQEVRREESPEQSLHLPSTPPPSRSSLLRGILYSGQETEAGSVVSFAEHTAFLSSPVGPPSPRASSPARSARKKSPGEAEPGSGSQPSLIYPRRSVVAAPGGVDRRFIPPLELVTYLHSAFPGHPLTCAHGAFSRGVPRLGARSTRVTHLVLRLENEGEAASGEGGNRPQPGEPSRQDSVEGASAAPASAVRPQTAYRPQGSDARPRQAVNRSEAPKGSYPGKCLCTKQAWAQPSSRFYPPLPSQGPATADYGVETRDVGPGADGHVRYAQAAQPAPQVTRIADVGTQWSEQGSLPGTAEDETDWSMTVECSRNTDRDVCDVCGSDLPGYSIQESTYSDWCPLGTEPAVSTKNSSELHALVKSEKSIVSELIYF